MANDMTWEQKCRISALRAACASPLDFQYTSVKSEEGGEFSTDHLTLSVGESDEHMTTRILQRAEMFRIALLGDGPLHARYHGQEALGPKWGTGETPSQYIATCKHCLTAIQLFDPFNDETARWVDRYGKSGCSGDHEGKRHQPELEDESSLSDFAVCPGCGASSRGMPLQIGITDGGIPLICNGPWHRS